MIIHGMQDTLIT